MFGVMREISKPGWHSRTYLPHFDANSAIQHLVLSGLPDVHFCEPTLAELIEAALLEFDRDRYCLHAWCIMPDHVHVRLVFAPKQLMGAMIRAWKSCITRQWQTRTGTSKNYFRLTISIDMLERLNKHSA
jgi:putative transposase